MQCTAQASTLTPAIGNAGLPALGASYDVTLSDEVAGSIAVLASGLSDSTWSGGSLPFALPGAPGCDLLVAPTVLDARLTPGASVTFSVPSNNALIGQQVFHQWGVLDAVNSAGIVFSNAGRARIGN